MFRKCFENRGGSETEHPGIPDMLAGSDIVGCVGQRRLFDKAVDSERIGDIERLAELNVTVAGLRTRWNDAERREPSLARERCCTFDRGLEGGGVTPAPA